MAVFWFLIFATFGVVIGLYLLFILWILLSLLGRWIARLSYREIWIVTDGVDLSGVQRLRSFWSEDAARKCADADRPRRTLHVVAIQ
jgi:hypothetical protein